MGAVGDDGIGRNVVVGVPRVSAELAVKSISSPLHHWKKNNGGLFKRGKEITLVYKYWSLVDAGFWTMSEKSATVS